jgi:hypothetical protein
VLDLSFVRAQVAHTYGRRGNKSVPLEVILRLMLLLFLDDIKSERELMRIIPEWLEYLLCPQGNKVRLVPATHRMEREGF